MNIHKLERQHSGEGIERATIPTCSCGWKGWTEYAHNDYMYANLREQEEKHLKDVEREIYLAEQSKRW